MIIRAALAGILFWFAGLAAFRFSGPLFFYPDERLLLGMFAAAPFIMIVVAWLAFKLLRVAAGDQAEAAIAFSIPGMIFSAYVTNDFSALFPPLDPLLDAPFGALMLEANAAILFAGLLFTRLQPADERL